ncbi:MAG: POTRA domain-containing protein, partial [Pseudomonadota bacterium]|nr:POTRA domain-containing protein [Pseudomonadota bacterium]
MDLTRCGLPIALAFLCVLSAIPVATSAGNGDHASRDKPPSVQLQTIEIDGVDTPLAQRLARGVSLTREPADGSRHPARLNRLAGEAVDEMQTMLSALGYRQARVVLIANPQPDMTSPARYRVTLGEPLRYRAFDLTMTPPPIKDPELIAGVELAREPLRAGAVVDQERYEQEKDRLLALARERGYFAARFTRHEILIDPEQYAARGRLHFDPGVRSRFGEVRIAESHLDPSLVQRMIRIQPGDPYQNRVLLLQEQALMDSDYFSSVSVSPSVAMQGPIKTLPLTVVTTPRNRHRYQAGAGVTTDIGPRLSIGWLNRYLNRQGHRLGLEGAAAPVQSSLEGEYRIPIRDPLQDSLQLRAGWSSTDSDSRESELFETSVERSIARGPWREG